jgi:hypothetical protein
MLRLLVHVLPIGAGALVVFLESAVLIMLAVLAPDHPSNAGQVPLFEQAGLHVGLLILGLLLFAVGLRTEAWSLGMRHDVTDAEVCWFCEKRPAEAGAICEVKMHRKMSEKDGSLLPVAFVFSRSIRYQKQDVPIARCNVCKNMHEYQRMGKVLSVVASFGVIGAMVSISADYLNWPTWVEIAIGIPAWLVFVGLSAWLVMVLPIKSPEDHPHVQRLAEEGWESGEQPRS